MNRIEYTALLCLVTFFGVFSSITAGDLEPPGPPGATMKTLVDVEPRKALYNDFDGLTPLVIASPGSYYLAEDIYAFPNAHGIEIQASHVTLDLNGFSVIGNTEVGSWNGIYAKPLTGFLENIVVKNGSVRSFFGTGVELVLAKYSMIDGVRALNNGLDGTGHGIRADTSIIKNSMAVGHPDDGIAGAGNIVTACISQGNDTGILGTVVTDSYAIGNAGIGIVSSSNGVVANSSAVANAGNGIQVTNSLAIGNATDGITVNGGSALHNEVN